VAAALARVVEAEHGIFTAIMGEDRKPDEGVVLLLDTSYSMQDTGFVAGKRKEEEEEEEEEEGDGEDGSIDFSEEEEEEEERAKREQEDDLEADVKFGLPALPHPVEILCPHELQCPFTQGILLDPVMASDGQARDLSPQKVISCLHAPFSLSPTSFPSPQTHYTS